MKFGNPGINGGIVEGQQTTFSPTPMICVEQGTAYFFFRFFRMLAMYFFAAALPFTRRAFLPLARFAARFFFGAADLDDLRLRVPLFLTRP